MRIIKYGGKIYQQHDKPTQKLLTMNPKTLTDFKLFRQVRILPGNLNDNDNDKIMVVSTITLYCLQCFSETIKGFILVVPLSHI